MPLLADIDNEHHRGGPKVGRMRSLLQLAQFVSSSHENSAPACVRVSATISGP